METFQASLIAESLPPDPRWVERQLQALLSPEAKLVQWAIVQVHPQQRQLDIEGCKRVVSGGTNLQNQVK